MTSYIEAQAKADSRFNGRKAVCNQSQWQLITQRQWQ